MFRPCLPPLCCGLAVLVLLPATASADDPPELDPADREVRQRETLRRIRDAPGVTTPRRAEEILRAQELVRERHQRELLRKRLESIGVSESPLTGTPPTDEQLAQLRTLAAQIRENVGASVELDLIDDYLNAVEERLATLALGEIDIYRRPGNFSPEDLEKLEEVSARYPRTNVARRVQLVQQELALRRDMEALQFRLDPEVAAAFDLAARSQLEVALQLVPRQRLQRLRDLAEVFAGTPTAAEIERQLEATKNAIDERRERNAAQDEAAAARSRALRGYWDARYGRTSKPTE